jgi:hypothetical protein
MILEDRSTVVLPDTPTLVLEAAIGSEIAVAEEAGNESRR